MAAADLGTQLLVFFCHDMAAVVRCIALIPELTQLLPQHLVLALSELKARPQVIDLILLRHQMYRLSLRRKSFTSRVIVGVTSSPVT